MPFVASFVVGVSVGAEAGDDAATAVSGAGTSVGVIACFSIGSGVGVSAGVAVTVGVGVSSQPGGYVPPPLPPELWTWTIVSGSRLSTEM